jgi:5-methylcytosine-specific restriction endonuclease McrA
MVFKKGHKINVGNKHRLGKTHSKETREKISNAQKLYWTKPGSREKHWNWKGGNFISRQNEHNSAAYSDWHSKVLEKYAYRCARCGERGRLVVHHIVPYSSNEGEEMRHSLGNGWPVCNECHIFIHRKGEK